MPSFVIHLAIGKDYMLKHKNEIKNEKDFLKGSIEPDLYNGIVGNSREKIITHFGNRRDIQSLYNLIKQKEDYLHEDFWKGYFLHLYADYLLYSKYFSDENLYDDYYKINKRLIEKYKIELPEMLKKYGRYFEGEPKYLTFDFLDNFIHEVTYKRIEDIIKELKGENYEYKN